MVFSRLFRKDHRHYMTQGEKYLQAERYADARAAFSDAAERAGGAPEDARVISERLVLTGNKLAELNLHEGERSLTGGDFSKAEEHFQLALSFAGDAALQEAARKALKNVDAAERRAERTQPAPKPQAHAHHGGCSSCGGHEQTELYEEVPDPDLGEEDRFHLLVGPLPGDLPERYAALGADFAKAYLYIHEGDDARALPILEKMRLSLQNDIVIYELALIMYRSRRVGDCAKLIEEALKINPMNPLCNLTKVQLAIDAGRFQDAVSQLKLMMEKDILADQALIMLGELYASAGETKTAMEYLSRALEIPTLAKSAAQKLMPLLMEEGRTQEAQYLAKRYLKGCC